LAFASGEGKKVKYGFVNTTAEGKKLNPLLRNTSVTLRMKLNPDANTPAAVKMNEINPKFENTRKIHRILTNQNPVFLYKV
jgi:hypothetical protein